MRRRSMRVLIPSCLALLTLLTTPALGQGQRKINVPLGLPGPGEDGFKESTARSKTRKAQPSPKAQPAPAKAAKASSSKTPRGQTGRSSVGLIGALQGRKGTKQLIARATLKDASLSDARALAREAYDKVMELYGGRVWGWLGNAGGVKCPDVAQTFNEFVKELAIEKGYRNICWGTLTSADDPWRILGIPIPGSSSLHMVPYVSIQSKVNSELIVSDPWGAGTKSVTVRHDFSVSSYNQSITGVIGNPPWYRSGQDRIVPNIDFP